MASASLRLNNGRSNSTNGRTKSTISCWVKRASVGVQQDIWSWGENNSSDAYLRFDTADNLEFQCDGGGGAYNTTQLYRDTNAWYHIVCTLDGSNATDTLRRRMWVNGVQVQGPYSEGTFSAAQIGNTVQQDFWIGGRARSQQSGATEYFDGLIAHFHYCDGYSYDVSSFGETDATTGIWKPKTSPSVNYGDNGFFLKFDNSANMGLDSSGNGVNLTTSGTVIQTKDTPSNVFCTNNRLWKQESSRYVNLSKINGLISGAGSSTWYQLPGTLGFTKGKYYWECKFSAGTNLDKNTAGVIDYAKTQEDGQFQDKTGSVFYKNEDGGETRIDGSTSSADYGTLAQNDILGVAVDMDAATPTVKFYKNGSLLVTASAASLAGKTVTPAQTVYTSGEYSVNYGNGYFATSAVASAENPDDGVGIFEHDVPAGYRALCTKSLNAQEYS